MARPITLDELAERARALYRQCGAMEAAMPHPNEWDLNDPETPYCRLRAVERNLGKCLAFARREVPRGGWGKWLATTEIPASAAYRLRKTRNDP